jgi:hypothetical protein
MPVLIRPAQCHIPEYGILHNLKATTKLKIIVR